jgi:phosphatidylserine decarboxylase
MAPRQKIVDKLIDLLESNEELKNGVEVSLEKANQKSIKTLKDFYDWLDQLLTHIPTEKELMPSVREFYYLLQYSPNDILKKDKAFNNWINEFVETRGDYMDSIESAGCLESFFKNPKYKIEHYIQPPSGWLTYNQFLGRHVKPSRRPISALCNDNVIISPADNELMGQWPLDENATVTVKGCTYNVLELISSSSYRNKFKNGIFIHGFLGVYDYHRIHVPISGKVVEIKKIPANTWTHEQKKWNGTIKNADNIGFQFEHTRGFITLETAIGYVTLIAVGMGHISSVTFTADENATLVKGDEFGYFAFGGSDVVMLFEEGKIELTAKEKKHYLMGEQIAKTLI